MLGAVLFNVAFYSLTLILAVTMFPFLVIPGFAPWIAQTWSRLTLWILKVTVGTKMSVQGTPPDKPCLVLSKHQSAWETIAFNYALDRPAFILKEELMWIPFFGLFLKSTGMIGLDRRGHIHALKKMIRDSKKTIADRRSIILFPEGTRSAPGSQGTYKKGAFLLYKNLNVPAVPVALNSGVFWPRRTFMKYKGTITLKFLDPIPPGLSESEFMEKIESAIETESRQLFHAVEKIHKN